jgi:hypothetical protein
LENPSLIGASELSSRLHSVFSVLTTLLFALLAEGLADLGGSACATLSISSAWFWYSVDQTDGSQSQLPRLDGQCTHSPGKTHTLFPYNASGSFTDCEPKRSVPKFFLSKPQSR